MSGTPDKHDPYTALSPIARYVAEVYGVVFPHFLTQTKIYELLTKIGRREQGKRITSVSVKNAIADLTRQGLVFESQQRGHRAASRLWAPLFTVAAHRSGHLDPLLQAFDNEQYRFESYSRSWSKISGARQDMLARCYCVMGRFDRFDTFAELNAIDWSFLNGTGAQHLIRTLPQTILPAALGGSLDSLISDLSEPEPMVTLALATVATCPDVAPKIAGKLAFIRVLQGRFTDALALFETVPDSKSVRVERIATQALIATLQGDDDTAHRALERAVAEQKKGTRKRYVFPDSRAFALALLALVRIDTPPATQLLHSVLQAGARQELQTPTRQFVQHALDIRSGIEPFESSPQHLFDLLPESLAACWCGDFEGYQQTARRNAFLLLLDRARKGGYRWLYAECSEVLRRMADAIELPKRLDAEVHSQEDLAGREAMGTVTLADVVQPLPAWEYPLKALEQVAYESRKPSKTKPKSKTAKRQRLIWELDSSYRGVVLTPRQQSANRNGSFSKGRVVSLKRLSTQAATMDFLIEQDREAATRIRAETYWGGTKQYYLDARGVYALAGHPHVFNDRGEPVEIVRREPQLVLAEAGEGLLLVRIEPYADDSQNYSIQKSQQRLEVTHFSKRHHRLCEIIPSDGLRLPESAKARLLDAVSTLAGEIQVQSALEGVASSIAETVPADAEPWVRLQPSGTGLAVSVVVEPVPGTGTRMTPGMGGATVIVQRDNSIVQTTRDLAAEHAAFDALVACCPLLAVTVQGDSITLENPEDCLELLDVLQTGHARCLWPEGEPYKVIGHADASQLSLRIKSADEWFEAAGDLKINDQLSLELTKLFELLDTNSGSRFIQIEPGKFLALSEVFQRQLHDLHSLSSSSRGKTLKIHPLAALALDDLTEQATLSADRAWRDQRTRLADAEAFQPEIPSTLDAELRPYQEEGFRWLARLAHWGAGACLADDMGLGKTVQTLALLLHRAAAGPALVVAPTSVVSNWITEAQRFAPTLNVIHYSGTPETRGAMLDGLKGFDLLILTYGLLHNDIERFEGVQWHSVVLDEAQAIKNAATKRARAVRALKANFRLVTTGTPVQNDLADLHSLFSFINPGMLGSAAQFRREFLLPVERDQDVDARTRLRRLIAPFLLRRLKNEVLQDLPPRTEIVLNVELSQEEAALYEALRTRALQDLEQTVVEETAGGTTHLRVLAHLTRLRLACCNPKLVLDAGAPASSKLLTFSETLQELLQNRHKVLVFSQFVTHLKLIEAHLREIGIDYQYLDGATPAKARAQRIAAFQAGEGDVFLISLKAGGTGLNLTAADYVIHMDPWWNPAVEDQASDRAHRIGQTRPVTIYRLVTRGTIEEQIVALHHRKRDLAEQLLEGADGAARLGVKDLLALLQEPSQV